MKRRNPAARCENCAYFFLTPMQVRPENTGMMSGECRRGAPTQSNLGERVVKADYVCGEHPEFLIGLKSSAVAE